jgi:hypothetical protein
MVEENIPLVDEILWSFKKSLKDDLPGYRNHVYRMINFCFAQRDLTEEERTKITIAGCFHDLGIWTGDTFDYLPPSIESAKRYLSNTGLEKWTSEIELMIDQHHKLRKFSDKSHPLVEIFRQGDLADFSLGLIKSGISGQYVREVKHRFPNAGFHKMLVRLAGRWICRHPFDPIPVLKW